eukprot:TRINITY_DN96400_c0_g1_i1.p1 TRINITY_DN96400_c0_g1~~TRINITY_DN96400_c0_g1_i1.p1  ORF type:complete len:260 (+),score=77.23 TRINITY_DN96400_c0_g1_i1:57-836(+)
MLRSTMRRCARPSGAWKIAAPMLLRAMARRRHAPSVGQSSRRAAVSVARLTAAKSGQNQDGLARSFSSETATKSNREDNDAEGEILHMYEGPFGKGIRRLKLFSIGSCALTIVGSPVLVFLSTADVPMFHRAALGAAVVTFGVATTAMLNWFVKPYVVNAWLLPPHDPPMAVRFETVDLLGRPKYTEVRLDDLSPDVTRPFGTFQDSLSGRVFFMHEDIVTRDDVLKPVFEHVILWPEEEEGQGQGEREREGDGGGSDR